MIDKEPIPNSGVGSFLKTKPVPTSKRQIKKGGGKIEKNFN
ncbi:MULTISPECIES: hypothetical protein [Bacillus]|nr:MULTISPECIES: hypothetical protein [Bacillus]